MHACLNSCSKMKYQVGISTALSLFAALSAVAAAPSHPLVLWYDKSAAKWEQALPKSAQTKAVGNDTLVMTGNTDMPKLKGNQDYEVDARVLVKGERSVEGANEAVVLLTCGTSLVLDYAKRWTRESSAMSEVG